MQLQVERDRRVADAIAHWAPRFVTQGVDYNDFQRVTSSLTAWDEWLPAWVENGHRHAELARVAEEKGRPVTAGEAWNQVSAENGPPEPEPQVVVRLSTPVGAVPEPFR